MPPPRANATANAGCQPPDADARVALSTTISADGKTDHRPDPTFRQHGPGGERRRQTEDHADHADDRGGHAARTAEAVDTEHEDRKDDAKESRTCGRDPQEAGCETGPGSFRLIHDSHDAIDTGRRHQTTVPTGMEQRAYPYDVGMRTTGTEEELIAAATEHGERVHNMRPTRDEVLAMVITDRPSG
jgi:hypothetical protein